MKARADARMRRVSRKSVRVSDSAGCNDILGLAVMLRAF
jgi:hypothetical protein